MANAQQQPEPKKEAQSAPAIKQDVAAKGKPKKELGDNIFNFQFHYTYVQPEGDLENRFGNFHNAGAGVLFKSQRNWVFSLDASYQFGTQVKEPYLFINLTNNNGVVMNSNGAPGEYSVGQRGFSSFVKVGKVFPVSFRNRNSGIVVMAGAGIYYHKINIVTSRNDIPTLTEEYRKGYDRLSMGPALTQFVGYYHHSHNRYYNFYIGLDCMQAFTKSVRKFNYDTMEPDTKDRNDLTFGIRLGWMIPIYMQSGNGSDEFEFR